MRICGLEKSYNVGLWRRRRFRALEPLHLDVPVGEVFGYIGPNGSGKTTTLKILMGLVMADAGDASILGHPYRGDVWRQRAGYLPEQPYFYDYLTAREYLDYAGRLLGLERGLRRDRAHALLSRLGLHKVADQPLRRYSKGMQQRLGLAQALLNDPEVVFLDEPMSGLDPLGRQLVHDLIQSLRSQRKSVFFSTHILPDAESLCDRVGLLRAGRLQSSGRLDEILDIDVSHLEVLVSGASSSFMEVAPTGVLDKRAVGDRWCLDVDENQLGRVIRAVEQDGGRVRSVRAQRLSLEEFFVRELGDGPSS